MFQIKLY